MNFHYSESMLRRCITNIHLPASRHFDKAGPVLAVTFATTLPWSLTLSYFSLYPLILLWVFALQGQIRARLRESRELMLPFAFLMAIFLVGSPFGVEPLRSLEAVPATIVSAITIFAIAEVVRRQGPVYILTGLLVGQSIAALHSVLQAGFPSTIMRLFLGPVTESGQLAIVSILVLGVGFSFRANSMKVSSGQEPPRRSTLLPLGLLLAFLLSTVSWIGLAYIPSHYPSLACSLTSCAPMLLFALFAVVIAACLAATYFKVDFLFRLPPGSQFLRALFLVFLPLLIAALVLNLKRGPWMGVFIGGSILVLIYQSRLLIPLYGMMLLGYLGLEPVRQRIAEIPDHFFITGGRSMLWDIGVDLSTRYPLGVGLKNSRFLQTFSEDIPHEINHFHNNFINITVEGGWIALSLFLWWIVSIVAFSIKRSTFGTWAPLAFSIGCAVVSWQVAGLVEYNWGDSEVRILVFLMVGVLLGLRSFVAREQTAQESAGK